MKIKTPSNINSLWNVGSNIGMFFTIQIILGLMLSSSYFFYSINMFKNSFYIYFNLNYGWTTRMFHSNLTSFLFILMIIHITRNLMYNTALNKMNWMTGITLFLTTMMISFLGYSLIWNQMSFWAMMVITNFIMVIPIIGPKLIKLIWGNYFINNILINRFFSLHFLLPFLMMATVMTHILFIHKSKSSNPLGINNKKEQINLSPIFIIKDLILFTFIILMFIIINMSMPLIFSNPDNFNKMNYFKTPNHIEPEWYFLLFYSVLRSIKNKMSGLLMMIIILVSWVMLPMMYTPKFQTNKFLIMKYMLIMMLLVNSFMLGIMGTKIMEPPFELLTWTMNFSHFMFMILFVM